MSNTNESRPSPALTPENAFFWMSGAEGVLKFLQCADCQHVVHPPQPLCPRCLSQHLAPQVFSGRANLATYTINHHQWHPAFAPPYALGIVEIVEAPYVRLTTRLVNCDTERLRMGMPLRVVFESVGDAWLPLFEPEEG